jgi:phosphoglycolate phosphatase-like HAD superfamily hydrolase
MKKYLIFDLDGTLIKSTESIVEIVVDFISAHFGKDFDEKIRYVLSNTK